MRTQASPVISLDQRDGGRVIARAVARIPNPPNVLALSRRFDLAGALRVTRDHPPGPRPLRRQEDREEGLRRRRKGPACRPSGRWDAAGGDSSVKKAQSSFVDPRFRADRRFSFHAPIDRRLTARSRLPRLLVMEPGVRTANATTLGPPGESTVRTRVSCAVHPATHDAGAPASLKNGLIHGGLRSIDAAAGDASYSMSASNHRVVCRSIRLNAEAHLLLRQPLRTSRS